MFDIRFAADSFTKELRALDGVLRAKKEDVVVPYYFQKLQGIAARAVKEGKQAIRDAVTPTGLSRPGEPGRVVTGDFIDGFTWKVVSESKGNYIVRIGWLDAKPDYASYQELGFIHRSGMVVTGADALGTAERYVQNEIEKLK